MTVRAYDLWMIAAAQRIRSSSELGAIAMFFPGDLKAVKGEIEKAVLEIIHDCYEARADYSYAAPEDD